LYKRDLRVGQLAESKGRTWTAQTPSPWVAYRTAGSAAQTPSPRVAHRLAGHEFNGRTRDRADSVPVGCAPLGPANTVKWQPCLSGRLIASEELGQATIHFKRDSISPRANVHSRW